MHISLPLVKSNKIFSRCSSGFTANLSVLLRETSMASDEVLFRANEVCNELYLISSSSVNLLNIGIDGEEKVGCKLLWFTFDCIVTLNTQTLIFLQVTSTRSKGSTVAEVSFFFRLRHGVLQPCDKHLLTHMLSCSTRTGHLSMIYLQSLSLHACRAVYTAMVGKATAVLFVLSYDDFKQLSATYVEDGNKIMEVLIVCHLS